MPFALLHKLSSYLMAAAAMGCLLLGPEISAIMQLAAISLFVASWFAEPPRFPVERLSLVWTIITFAALAAVVFSVLRGGSVIDAAELFLLALLINKLFNRSTSKDYLQLAVVSFLLLVMATTVNSGLSYALSFVAYVLVLPSALVLLQLRREMEQAHLWVPDKQRPGWHRGSATRTLVGPGFLAGTSLLSLGVMTGAVAVFAFFPRIGFGMFSSVGRAGPTMAGFSEEVELGRHGVIRSNPQVVMRVVFDRKNTAAPSWAEQLHWRGSVYDQYHQGAWSHSEAWLGKSYPCRRVDDVYCLSPAPGLPPDRLLKTSPARLLPELLRQEIYLEPLGSTVLFAADRPVALATARDRVRHRPLFEPRRGPHGELRTRRAPRAGIHYVAYSKLYDPPAAVARRAHLLSHPSLEPYLQLPASLPQRVRDLARKITRGRSTAYDKALAVRDYLQRHYTYTLTLEHRAGHEPIDEFLFETRRGHCEYFATAMALLLRVVGVPTRQVNGFLGGQWNSYGRYLAVRQGDAHAWTEVLLGELGWVAFDATPGNGRQPVAARGLAAAFGQMLDALRLRWFSYVVEYDLNKQIALVGQLKRLAKGKRTSGANKRSVSRPPLRLGLTLLLIAGAFVVVWRWRQWRRQRRNGEQPTRRGPTPWRRRHPATVLYQRALRLLARNQQTKPASATPLEHATTLTRHHHRCANVVDQLTHDYYAARFSGRRWSPDQEAQLSRLVAELKHTLQPRR